MLAKASMPIGLWAALVLAVGCGSGSRSSEPTPRDARLAQLAAALEGVRRPSRTRVPVALRDALAAVKRAAAWREPASALAEIAKVRTRLAILSGPLGDMGDPVTITCGPIANVVRRIILCDGDVTIGDATSAIVVATGRLAVARATGSILLADSIAVEQERGSPSVHGVVLALGAIDLGDSQGTIVGSGTGPLRVASAARTTFVQTRQKTIAHATSVRTLILSGLDLTR